MNTGTFDLTSAAFQVIYFHLILITGALRVSIFSHKARSGSYPSAPLPVSCLDYSMVKQNKISGVAFSLKVKIFYIFDDASNSIN